LTFGDQKTGSAEKIVQNDPQFLCWLILTILTDRQKDSLCGWNGSHFISYFHSDSYFQLICNKKDKSYDFSQCTEKNDPVEEAIQVCSNAEASHHLQEVRCYLQLRSRTSDLDFNSLTHLKKILIKKIVDKQSTIIDFFIPLPVISNE
jgi:hypothetical protein